MSNEYPELSAYLDGEVTDSERGQIEERLAVDTEFAHELAQLRKAKTMLTAYVEEASCRASVLGRIHEEKRGKRRINLKKEYVLAAAVLVMVAVAAILWLSLAEFRQPGTLRPTTPAVAVAPSQDAHDSEEKTEGNAVSTPTPEVQPFQLAQVEKPTFQLIGTVTGDTPSAILTMTQDGTQTTKTVSVGDVVADGITLVEVRENAVVLDVNGEQVTVSMGMVPTTSPLDSLAGRWRVAEVGNGQESEVGQAQVTLSGTRFSASSSNNEINFKGTVRMSGKTAVLMVDPDGKTPTEMDATINDEGNKVRVTTVRDPRGELMRAEDRQEFTLTRIAEADYAAEAARQAAWQQRAEGLKAMYEVLHRYAVENGYQYPSALEQLVPRYARDLAMFANTATRTVQYYAGQKISPPIPVEYPTCEPIATYADRLMALEQQLRQSGVQNYIFPQKLLRVVYKEPDTVGAVYTNGRVNDETKPPELSDESTLRASCANNLKQLGLVVKMFENERCGYFPPGWLSTYPEYLTDTNILTCPLDPPGTDSYVYLLPAVNVQEVVNETLSRIGELDNPAGSAKLQSEIPVSMNKTPFTNPPGRNVLFSDGHVEFVRMTSDFNLWRDKVPAYIDRSIFSSTPW